MEASGRETERHINSEPEKLTARVGLNAVTVISSSWGQFNKHNPLISICTLPEAEKELEIR